MSASPRARISSAVSGMVMRFEAITGIDTCGRSRPVIHVNAPRGTEVTMVGTRASCQPMPVLMIVAPAPSTAAASASVSSQVWPSSTRSSNDMR